MSFYSRYNMPYPWTLVLVSAFMVGCNGAQESDSPLSGLPAPIVQRIEYEFGDTSNVDRIEEFPAPKESY